jgi:hypothetical protein
MKSHRPLPATHPELAFFERPGWVEFRVDNSRLAYDGSGKVVKGYSAWSWFDALVPVVLAALWPKVGASSTSSPTAKCGQGHIQRKVYNDHCWHCATLCVSSS